MKGWLFDRRPFNDVLLSTQLTHGLLFFYFATYRPPLLIHNELDPVIYRRRTDVALLLFSFLFFFLFKHESWRRKSYLVSPRDGNANRATRWTFFMTYTAHWAGQLFSSGQHTAWHLSSWQLSKLVDDSVRLPPVSRDPKIMQHLKWWACPGDKSPRHIWLRFQKKTATDSYFNVISLAWIIWRNWRPVKVETWRAWRIQ